MGSQHRWSTQPDQQITFVTSTAIGSIYGQLAHLLYCRVLVALWEWNMTFIGKHAEGAMGFITGAA